MTRKRHTEEQIIALLKDAPSRHRGAGALPQTPHLRRHVLQVRTKYAGLDVSDMKKLRQLETKTGG